MSYPMDHFPILEPPNPPISISKRHIVVELVVRCISGTNIGESSQPSSQRVFQSCPTRSLSTGCPFFHPPFLRLTRSGYLMWSEKLVGWLCC